MHYQSTRNLACIENKYYNWRTDDDGRNIIRIKSSCLRVLSKNKLKSVCLYKFGISNGATPNVEMMRIFCIVKNILMHFEMVRPALRVKDNLYRIFII